MARGSAFRNLPTPSLFPTFRLAFVDEDRPVFRGVLADGERRRSHAAAAHPRLGRTRAPGTRVYRHVLAPQGTAGSSGGAPLSQRAVVFVSRRSVGIPQATGCARGCRSLPTRCNPRRYRVRAWDHGTEGGAPPERSSHSLRPHRL